MVYLLYKRARPRPFIYINANVIQMSLFAGYCAKMVFCCMFEPWKTYLTITTRFNWHALLLASLVFSSLLALSLLLIV